MNQIDYVSLHNHLAEGSLLDGAAKISNLVKKASELGMKALAVTDHGSMYAVVDFYKACKKAGIKPIIGCEVYVAPRKMSDRVPGKDDANYHLVLLAQSNEGYANLIKLVSAAYIDGFYYKPRVDKELLQKHSAGLIALSACLGGEIPVNLLQDRFDDACRIALEYDAIFGRGNFYLELQDHDLADQKKVNAGLWRIAGLTGIPLVATNDVHYVNQEDSHIQDVLLCIQTGKTLQDSGRLSLGTKEFYLKSAEEMVLRFGDLPEVLTNTLNIADRCNVEFNFGDTHLPVFEIPEGFTPDSYLKKLCEEAFPRFYPAQTQEQRARLDYELGVIAQTGFAGYFLIVSDFCRWAKQNQVAVGPGRGSAAASMVAYILEITSVEPMRHNLIFERFLNPERVSMPDIDIDFDPDGRGRVIQYVTEKYGTDKVGQIITFGTMGAKAAIRDVGRVLGMPLYYVDKVAKAVPNDLGITLAKAMEVSPDLKRMVEEDSQVKNLLDVAKGIEGMPRHSSTHAAGVVIAKEPLNHYVPLQRTTDGTVMTQFPMKTVEELGLLKMDFLGLRNLTILQECIHLVKKNRSIEVDLLNLPLDDAKTYELLSAGNSTGVFQLESSGMRQILRELKPACFDDIIAVEALYRPGPMEQIPEFIRRKNGGEITYLHPKLEPILKSTYGIIVYQEQVMQIARDLAGYSLGRADLLRRAMGKKKKEIMEEERKSFISGLKDSEGNVIIPGALNMGVKQEDAEAIFDLMAKFAEYGFNKGHATAYAVISYQTAYLKSNYRLEFMTALLSTVMSSNEKVAFYLNEVRSSGLNILPPSVQYSDTSFAIEKDAIRFGLAAIHNVGENVIAKIIESREEGGLFKSLYDFCIRMNSKVLNKRVLESLLKAGALSSLCTRAQGLAGLDTVLSVAQKRQKDLETGQISLFDIPDTGYTDEGIKLPDVPEISDDTVLAWEKEYLGLYLSGHPLASVMPSLKKLITTDLFTLQESEEEANKVIVGGIVTNYRSNITKKGEYMAFFLLEDLTSSIEIVVFPKLYAQINGQIAADQIVVVEGRYNIQDDEKKILAEKITPLEQALQKEKRLYLKVPNATSPVINEVISVLRMYHGNNPVYFFFADKRTVVQGRREYWVHEHSALDRSLVEILGTQNVVWKH